jgi:hypothetical protein
MVVRVRSCCSLPTVGQQRFELSPRVKNPRLHGINRTAGNGRDFPVRMTLEVRELDGDAML